jgi:nitroreductase
MNVTDAILKRRSVRAFKSDPIPQEILNTILATASAAPSNCNTQPWHLAIVSGEARERLEQAIFDEIESGKPPSGAFKSGDKDLSGVYRERQIKCAMDYYATVGIERGDKDKRNALMLKNWEFFGAPHVGFLSMPKSMGEVNAVDVGIYLQTLMLLLVEHGLASCPQGALAYYPGPIFDIADIPEGNAILCGISFGYPEEDAQINKVPFSRENLDAMVSFTS